MGERRDFLTRSAGLLLLRPDTAFGTQANSAVEIGIVGAGSRGTWIADHFIEHTGARVIAVAEPFDDRRSEAVSKYKLDPARAYKGRDGHKELAASKLDAVVIESPPYFHPEQAEAAVAAGKHVFLAKPVAVDVDGCRRIAAAGARAVGKLSFLVDFQTRARPVFQEAANRVHKGEIGSPVLGHVYYHARQLPEHTSDTLSTDQLVFRNWMHNKQLSGDIIVEQNIHVIDAANWYLQAHPIRAVGTYGRKARLLGDTSDHFVVTYWYPNDVKVDFSSAQFLHGYGDLCIRIYGSKGTLDSHYNGLVRITGQNPWPGAPRDDTFTGGAVTNVKTFIESIRTGKPVNNADHGAESTLSAILGRTAAYQGKPVTWDEMMRSNDKWSAKVPI
ncbi:MAG TPA: Gfo/Idh/MocA family oxidoreductase [Bryobacteraceae bacterium]|nr:Gfo/Idh/MocA family oxidoreductase [Bryobacteraceae bacterium]